jgi:heat shock protein HslJ
VKSALTISSLLLIGLTAGCASGDGYDVARLEGSHWALASARDATLPLGVVPTAGFHEGIVRGFTGCNQYSAPYSVDGGSLDIGDVASTRMACEAPRDGVERAYVRALGRVLTWHRDGEQLVLSDGEGELLRYKQARTGGDI